MGIITEIDEYRGVITSKEGSLQLSPTKVCLYVAELKGCDREAATCTHPCGCRAGGPIYILCTNECLIRRGG